ncbi:MAG: ATP-dependent metalloprotease, partial [Steroidobacteraceae bacterium]
EEIRRLIDDNYQRARDILSSSMEKLHVMAEALIRYETIDEQQIKDIMDGRQPNPPAGWEDSGKPPGGKPEAPAPAAPAVGPAASQH